MTVPVNSGRAANGAAAAAHQAWLADSGLAPRSCSTYRQQVAAYLGWLADHPRRAAWLTGPAAGSWYAAAPGGTVTACTRDPAAASERHAAASAAAAAYQRDLAATGAAPATIKLAMTAISSLHRAVGLDRPTGARPVTRPYPTPAALTDAEARRLLQAAAARGPRDHALVTLSLVAGLRPGEITALDASDLSPGAGQITVRSTTYGHRTRTVPIPPESRDALTAWQRARPPGAGPAYLTTRTGTRIAARTLNHLIRQAGQAAGLDLSPATLRHTRATRLTTAGTSPHAAAALLGHARPETLRPYPPPPAPPAVAVEPRGPRDELPATQHAAATPVPSPRRRR